MIVEKKKLMNKDITWAIQKCRSKDIKLQLFFPALRRDNAIQCQDAFDNKHFLVFYVQFV